MSEDPTSRDASSFLEIASETGVTISHVDDTIFWEGPISGKTKPVGPLAGKRVGVLIASEFSDFQAYYMASYASEFGAEVVFLLVDWVKYKFTRPNVSTKGVHGMWGMSVDPIPVMASRHAAIPLGQAHPEEYDALVVLGGHSGDVTMTEDRVIDFIKDVDAHGAMIGAIGGGSIPLITAGVPNGKTTTGNAVVSFMLERIGTFVDEPVVRDGRLITARDTVDTPASVRELCKAFDPDFVPQREGILIGKRVLMVAGEDFEDIELAVPVMEYI